MKGIIFPRYHMRTWKKIRVLPARASALFVYRDNMVPEFMTF